MVKDLHLLLVCHYYQPNKDIARIQATYHLIKRFLYLYKSILQIRVFISYSNNYSSTILAKSFIGIGLQAKSSRQLCECKYQTK
jgi:hypothetical protein